MCWSIGISLLAAGVHALTHEVARNYRPPGYRSDMRFVRFFLIMELFQAAQWQFGDVGTCSEVNRLFTLFAYLLIWVQPLLFVAIGEQSQLHAVKVRLEYARLISIITAWYAVTLLLVGNFYTPTYLLPGSSFGEKTCTTVGPYGHLAWQFSPLSIVYGPTHFVYYILISTIFYFYPARLQWTIGLGWWISLFFSLYWVGPGIELPAFWCLLSASVDIPILIRSLLHKRR